MKEKGTTEEAGIITDARESIKKYMEESGKTQTVTAKEIGVSSATLSLFMKGRYAGDNEEVAASIRQFLYIDRKRKVLAQKPPVCVEIKNTSQILEKVYVTQATGDILLIYGDAGCGKTTALQYYQKNNRNVIYIEADVTNNSYRAILGMIAEEMGENGNMSTASMMRRVISRLKGTTTLLVIDEAQHLAPKAFDAIRALNDKAGIGIVYAGNPSIKKRMYGTRQDDYDQVYSRIGYHCPLYNRYSKADIEAIFKGCSLNGECLGYLHKTAQRKGGMRVMVKQYCVASNIALSLGEEFGMIHLQDAAERMGIERRPETDES